MIQSMQDLERTFNRKFNYPWMFFNDVEFSEEFKRRTAAETKAKISYRKGALILAQLYGSPHDSLRLLTQSHCRCDT